MLDNNNRRVHHAPMAMAIPPRLMMFAVNPIKYMGIKERMMVIGIVIIGTRADGICQRKT
jgi:hypothetical protein